MATVNQIQKKIGSLLLDNAVSLLRDAYHVKDPKWVSFGDITNIVRASLGNIPVGIRDTQFALTSWDKWQNLFDGILQEKIKYYSERFDCDNYANLVSSMASLFMVLNSCGVAHGVVYHKDTGDKIAGHYFNLIATKDNEVYLYDLNNGGGYVKHVKGQDPVIGNWKYRFIDRVEFY